MTLEVLQTREQIRAARAEMKSRGISFTDTYFTARLKELGLLRSLSLGDTLKSWDVFRTVKFLEQTLAYDAAILDIGCFCSEVLLSLQAAGFNNLTGNDLNPEIATMPQLPEIQYRQENFLQSSLLDGSFEAITSISVLEHGFNGPAYLGEMSRLLKPGGYLLTSFDYWPEKIDTGDTTFFDMSWTLFSRQEILDFVQLAKGYGLGPVGEMHTGATDKPIKCAGFSYTFGWLALRKSA